MDNSILAMSDEDLLALGPQAYTQSPAEVEQEENKDNATTEPEKQPEVANIPAVVEEEEDEKDPEGDPSVDPDEEKQDPAPEAKPTTEQVDPAKAVEAKPADKEPAKADEPAKEKTPVVSPEDQLAKLFAPFKASGREIKIDSVDEAVQLMQKGVNYHDKMAALKPSLNIVRMLEREGLLDQGKLNHLIDLHKKNPEAIAKLVKDSGVDLLEVDDKKVAGYKPGQYELSDTEAALEDTMAELKLSPAYDRVIDFAGNRMDTASKQLIIKNPGVLLHLASQVENGVFDVIQAELGKQKVLGNLKGMTELEAYDAVGKALAAKGAFNHLQQQPAHKPEPVVVTPKAQKPVDPAVAKAKAAAAPAKANPSGKSGKPDFNPLALSDEEFAKLTGKNY